MDTVTLLHTRWPKDEFIYSGGENIDDVDNLSDAERGALYRTAGRPITKSANVSRISGMWGTMLMLVGGSVRAAQYGGPIMGPLLADERRETVTFNRRPAHIVVAGDIKFKKEFTTIERYRTNSGTVNQWDLGYVRLMGRDTPYGLRVEKGNSAVMKLRAGHDGSCIRVLGGSTEAQRGILIHEAPHVGWVIGCIGPRPFGDREAYPNRPGNPSDKAVREIISEISKRGGKGSMFVLRG